MLHRAVPVVALTAALAALSSCSRPAKTEASSGLPAETQAPAVAVAKVAPADLSLDLVLTAEFRPYQEIDLHAKVAGYLKTIYVDVGDRVAQGQLIATLEIPEMADDLTRATAAQSRSDAELQRAREELARSQSAHEASHLSFLRLSSVIKTRPNLVAQQEIDEAQARDRVSEAQVSAARAALAAAEQGVQVSKADTKKVQTISAYSRITAPFAGVITKRYADTGAMIQAGTASQSQAMPVVQLSQVSTLRLVLPAPESVVPRIRIGELVAVRVPSLDRTFEGKVARFSGKVASATRTMETEVDVPNPSLVLIPGMYAEAVLTLDRRAGVVAVPVQAVDSQSATRGAKSIVYLVTPRNTIEERQVKLGLETPTQFEVLSGLQPGDLVVTSGRAQIRPGQKVQPRIVETAQEAR